MQAKKKKSAPKNNPSKKKIIKKTPKTIKKKKPTLKKPAKRPASKQSPKLRPNKPKTAPKKPKAGAKKRSESGLIGKVTHYFAHVNAAVLKLNAPLGIGDKIRIQGHTTDIKETVTSMQINLAPITAAKKGDEIGLLVSSRVRTGDTVYKT